MLQPVALKHASRLVNHGPTVLVTTEHACRWSFRDDNAELHTLHHLGGGAFAVPSRVVQARR